jgi:hypothetical protein
VDIYVDRWQDKERGLLPKLVLETEDPIETDLALGILWSNQIIRQFGWSWVCILSEGKESYAVVSPDRSQAIYATYFIKYCLDRPTADSTVMLALNMQVGGKLAGEAPNDYASLLHSVRRLVPKP